MLTETLREALPVRRSSTDLYDLVRVVDRQTQRQVEGLAIQLRGGELVVTGRSRTYYVKQLVTQALQKSAPSVRFANEICVV